MPLAYLLLGFTLLAVLLLLARWFSRADPATLVAVVKWVGGVLAALVALYLIVSGRGAWLFPLVFVGLPFLRRLLRGGGPAFGGFGGTRPSPGHSSGVETAYLRMTLDHDSGQMEGTVLRGPFAGRALSSLGLDELLSLLAECARVDAQSAQLIETYLDRGGYDDWRERMDTRERSAGKVAMTPEEAREILGIGEDATAEDIKEAHRRLMQAMHPDHGDSTYLAARINLAKEVLLGP